jgi:DNA-binding MarR family transcriptional regulator
MQSKNSIKNFNFTKKIVDDPLKERIKYGEIRKKYLTLIYLYSKKKNDINFDSKELVEQFDITLTMNIRVLKELKSKGFIKLVDEKKPIFNGNLLIGQSPRKYQLTDKGLNLARELLS